MKAAPRRAAAVAGGAGGEMSKAGAHVAVPRVRDVAMGGADRAVWGAGRIHGPRGTRCSWRR